MLQRERATACASSVQRYVKLHDRKGFTSSHCMLQSLDHMHAYHVTVF